MADSYGLVACQLAQQVEAQGVTVSCQGLGRRITGNQSESVRRIIERNTPAGAGGIALGYPTNYARMGIQPGPQVALTMIESSKIPQSWVDVLNTMQAVITPSRFCASVFEKCGVRVPVHVIPLGVGDLYQYAERDPDRPLTFLAFLDRGGRKGGILALQAFLRAFGEDMRYRLVLKGRTTKAPFTLTNPNIEVVQRDMSEAELYHLYCDCDVLVNPHKGEGFGLLPREAAASGMIALTTAWSGTADYLNLWGYPLPYTLEQADWTGHAEFAPHDMGLWAQPDVAGIAAALRDIADDIATYRQVTQDKAQAARELYSWQRCANQVRQVWEGVQ